MRSFCRACSFLLTLMFGVSATAAAQRLSAGVVAGVGVSTLSDYGDVGPVTERRRIGLLAGASLDVPLGRWVSLQPEVVYIQKGGGLEAPAVPGASSSVVVALRFDYIAVAILVRVGATAGRNGVYGIAGPTIGRLVRAREHMEAAGFPTEDQDIKDGVTSTDASLALGAGLSIGRLDIEGRFDAGLRNLIPPADRRFIDREPTNRSVILLARVHL